MGGATASKASPDGRSARMTSPSGCSVVEPPASPGDSVRCRRIARRSSAMTCLGGRREATARTAAASCPAASGSCLEDAQARRCSAAARQHAAEGPQRAGLPRRGGPRAPLLQRCQAPSPRGRRRRRARLQSSMRRVSAAQRAAACVALLKLRALLRACEGVARLRLVLEANARRPALRCGGPQRECAARDTREAKRRSAGGARLEALQQRLRARRQRRRRVAEGG